MGVGCPVSHELKKSLDRFGDPCLHSQGVGLACPPPTGPELYELGNTRQNRFSERVPTVGEDGGSAETASFINGESQGLLGLIRMHLHVSLLFLENFKTIGSLII